MCQNMFTSTIDHFVLSTPFKTSGIMWHNHFILTVMMTDNQRGAIVGMPEWGTNLK